MRSAIIVPGPLAVVLLAGQAALAGEASEAVRPAWLESANRPSGVNDNPASTPSTITNARAPKSRPIDNTQIGVNQTGIHVVT